jgi:hypothetical protein
VKLTTRHLIRGKGQHRARPVLLPDEPIPAAIGPVRHAVLSEAELERLLDEGTAEPLESAACPCCDRNTPHAIQKNGSRRCWQCGTTTKGDS